MSAEQVSRNWSHYTISEPKRKRAELVCTTCHSKKTKCDLQVRRAQNHEDCSYCHNSGRECQERHSRREKRQRVTKTQSSHPLTPPNDAQDTDRPQNSAPSMNLDSALAFTTDQDGVADRFINPRLAQQPTASEIGSNSLNLIATGSAVRHGLGGQQVPPQPFVADQSPWSRSSVTFARSNVAESHRGDVDLGFLHIYRQETSDDARNQALDDDARRIFDDKQLPVVPELLNGFTESYYENCYAFCPVLDRDSIDAEMLQSPLLTNAVALAGSHTRPPMLPHDGPSAYYNRARWLFYDDHEPDSITCLKAILLFYWWAPRSTSMVHRHSSWWWTSVVIRHAQQMNLHRQTAAEEQNEPREELGLRRRIWWTAVSRERLTALCQSKPAIVNIDDCNVPTPSLEDFPPSVQNDIEVDVFISWVQLCTIIGKIAQHQSRSYAESLSAPFPRHLSNELVSWARSLPPRLSLQIHAKDTPNFQKHVHQLHLPYLIAVIVLNLKKATSPGSLPRASPPAILAASCVARIFKDMLARGEPRYLMAITSWYCAVSFLALLSASKDPALTESIAPELDIIMLTCNHLKSMWGSAQVIYNGISRLRAATTIEECPSAPNAGNANSTRPGTTEEQDILPNALAVDAEWLEYFPFASRDTSKTAHLLLDSKDNSALALNDFLTDSSLLGLQNWFEPFSDHELGLVDASAYSVTT